MLFLISVIYIVASIPKESSRQPAILFHTYLVAFFPNLGSSSLQNAEYRNGAPNIIHKCLTKRTWAPLRFCLYSGTHSLVAHLTIFCTVFAHPHLRCKTVGAPRTFSRLATLSKLVLSNNLRQLCPKHRFFSIFLVFLSMFTTTAILLIW